jgi:hypothetical protein
MVVNIGEMSNRGGKVKLEVMVKKVILLVVIFDSLGMG